MTIESVNPVSGEILKRYDELTPGEIAATIEEVDRAFASWRTTSFDERARHMREDFIAAKHTDKKGLFWLGLGCSAE